MRSNLFNEDFQEFLEALLEEDVKFMLVGGYAVILHGYDRTTGDMDLWLDCTEENYLKLTAAFKNFGMPLFDMSKEKFLNHRNYNVFTFGREPSAIEILTSVTGLTFDNAYEKRAYFEYDELRLPSLSFDDLLAAKKAAGRLRDLDDIEQLTREEE